MKLLQLSLTLWCLGVFTAFKCLLKCWLNQRPPTGNYAPLSHWYFFSLPVMFNHTPILMTITICHLQKWLSIPGPFNKSSRAIHTASLGLSCRLPSTGNYSHPQSVTMQALLPLGWTHTHTTNPLNADSGLWFWVWPDPFLHWHNPPKCTLMAAWSMGTRWPCWSNSKRWAHSNKQRCIRGIQLLPPPIAHHLLQCTHVGSFHSSKCR